MSRIEAEIWRVVLPLPRVIDTPLGPFREVGNVVIRLRDHAGAAGCGYTVAMQSDSLESVARIVRDLVEAQSGDLRRLLWIERTADDCDAVARRVVAAISLAAWDLRGVQLGKSCAELWGGHPHRGTLPAYASALFLDRTVDELVSEAASLRAAGYRAVKMRGGKSVAEDASRYNAVCDVFVEHRAVAIDFVFQSTLQHVQAFRQSIRSQPMWIEDPTGYDVIEQFAPEDGIAAGEQCVSAEELVRLQSDGIERLILDVAYLGGPLRFLEAARFLQALGAQVGAHMYAHESIHLLAALPRSMPVEMLDWWNPLFDEEPRPDGEGRYAVSGPGFGRALSEATLRRWGSRFD